MPVGCPGGRWSAPRTWTAPSFACVRIRSVALADRAAEWNFIDADQMASASSVEAVRIRFRAGASTTTSPATHRSITGYRRCSMSWSSPSDSSAATVRPCHPIAHATEPLGRGRAGIGEDTWVDTAGMPGAQVATSDYAPTGWPADSYTIVRRVRVDAEAISAEAPSGSTV